MHKKADQDPVDRLRERGVRVTPQRTAVLRALLQMGGHPSAQEVFDHANQYLPQLNLATVYRNLYRLHETGIVDLLTTPTGVQRFAYRDPDHLHAHLVCKECERVEAVSPELFEGLASQVQDRYGFEIDGRHMALTGICKDCLESLAGSEE